MTIHKYAYGSLNDVSSYDEEQFEQLSKDPLQRAREMIYSQGIGNSKNSRYIGIVLRMESKRGDTTYSGNTKVRNDKDEINEATFKVRIPELDPAIPTPSFLGGEESEFDEAFISTHQSFTMAEPNTPLPAQGDLVYCDFDNRSSRKGPKIYALVNKKQGAETGGIVTTTIQGPSQSFKMRNGKPINVTESDFSQGIYNGRPTREDLIPLLQAVRIHLVPGAPRISSAFGPRTHPVTKEKGKMHTGIDISAPTGQVIICPYDARVFVVRKYPNPSSTAGEYLVLRHTGSDGSIYYTHYMHNVMIEESLTQGTEVKKGQTICYVGNTGRSAGPHLHWEIRKGRVKGTRIDPKDILKKEGLII